MAGHVVTVVGQNRRTVGRPRKLWVENINLCSGLRERERATNKTEWKRMVDAALGSRAPVSQLVN